MSALPATWRITFDRPAQIKAVLVGAAFIAVFWDLLGFLPAIGGGAAFMGELVYKWLNDGDWSHGPIIPVFSAYLVYVNWDRIRRCRVKHTWIGLVLIIVSLFAYLLSLSPWFAIAIGAFRPYTMMLCLLGVVIFLCGLPVLRYAWVPWLYLAFAIPLPKGIYFRLTDPLRRMAATVATSVLAFVPELQIEQLGSMIEFSYRGAVGAIGVADACSGMRSTMTLCALGVAVAFMSDRVWWQRLILVASCVPIAVFCNFLRVITTCFLHIFVDPKYATGTYHTILGLLVLLIAFGIFSVLAWVLSNLVVEESDDGGADDAGAQPIR